MFFYLTFFARRPSALAAARSSLSAYAPTNPTSLTTIMYALAILSLVNLILQLVPVPKKAAATTAAAGAGAATKTDAKTGKMMAESVADYVVGAIANLSEKYD
jgi:hypothetical protein